MTRSYRHTKIFPIASNSAGTMQWWKQYFHSRQRVNLRSALAHGDYEGAEAVEHWDEWGCPRDGKRYWADAPQKEMWK